jgi:hypothetical protein
MTDLPFDSIKVVAMAEDARRTQRVKIEWTKDGAAIGRLYVGGEFWGAIEWSAKREAWCVEDAEGACLSHVASIRGQTSSRSKAVRLAREMLRDGRLPTPEQAKAEHQAHRAAQAERRARQPAVQARKRTRAEEMAQWTARWGLGADERRAQPLWEALHEVFDFADPELWRSNSFAVLRPRLVVHLRAVAAKLEDDCTNYRKAPGYRRETEWQRRSLADAEAKLAKVRKVLAAMEVADNGAPHEPPAEERP